MPKDLEFGNESSFFSNKGSAIDTSSWKLRDMRRCSVYRWFSNNLRHCNNRNKEIFRQTFTHIKRNAMTNG